MTFLEILVAVSLTLSVTLTMYSVLAIREQNRRIQLLQQMCESRYNRLLSRMERGQPTRREPTRRRINAG